MLEGEDLTEHANPFDKEIKLSAILFKNKSYMKHENIPHALLVAASSEKYEMMDYLIELLEDKIDISILSILDKIDDFFINNPGFVYCKHALKEKFKQNIVGEVTLSSKLNKNKI